VFLNSIIGYYTKTRNLGTWPNLWFRGF